MRTETEIQAEIAEIENDPDPDWDERGFEYNANNGSLQAFRAGLIMLKEGATEAKFLEWAIDSERGYTSWGDDARDYEQNGFNRAAYWLAEQYDWDAVGNVIGRAGNILGLSVEE